MLTRRVLVNHETTLGLGTVPCRVEFVTNSPSKATLEGDTTPASDRHDYDEFTRPSRLSWANLIRRVYEVDPLLCSFCGAEMKILAFILDFATAKAIRDSLELPDQEPEPLAHPLPKR